MTTTRSILGAAAVAVLAGGLVLWSRAGQTPAPTAGAPTGDVAAGDGSVPRRADPLVNGTTPFPGDPVAADARPGTTAAPGPNESARSGPPPASDARWAWPSTPRTDDAAASARSASGTQPVATELAFAALQYVGVDPDAERTWRRAIDDLRTPAGLRSDLIEDLNQEGFTDNSHPTAADLPLIVARLELIERLAPFAIDPVNAAAFEEAYKDLLAMYERLGGAPRERR